VNLLEKYPQETVGEPVRECRVCQYLAERGKGKNDMVNPGELSINIVMSNKPKLLTGLYQKGKQAGVLPNKWEHTVNNSYRWTDRTYVIRMFVTWNTVNP